MAIGGFPRTPGTNSRPSARKLPLTLLGPTLGNPQMLDRPDGSRTSAADRAGGSRPPSDPMSAELIDWLASVADDPYAFALGAFPWGEPGTVLESHVLDPWQIWVLCALRDRLIDLRSAIQIAVASGHGIGKSALVAIIILWAFTTFPDTLGVVTANTETQLKTKTWSALGKWFNLCWFASKHFTLNATSLVSRDPSRERTWRIDMIPWSEKNPEAFAGMHNEGKRILMIFDEASAIHDLIWETT